MDYASTAVRALLGATAHPGGVALTDHVLARLALPVGALLGDVACGDGTTLRRAASLGLLGVGVDLTPDAVARAGPAAVVADAHALPWRDGSLDAVVCECSVSTFDDPGRALAEVVRVLRPGGTYALTDIVLRRDLASPQVVAAVDRLTGARDVGGYRRLLADAGLRVVREEDRRDDAVALAARVARRLRLAGARKTAAAARACRDAAATGALSYVLLVAVRD